MEVFIISVALVIIDTQNDYCHPEGVFAKANFDVTALPSVYRKINGLIAKQRKKNEPVIWVKMIWANDEEVGLLGKRSKFLAHEGLRKGTWGAEIVEELDVKPDDIFIEKKRFSAFYNTNLDETLKSLGVQKFIIAGVRTDFCVESTIRDGFFRDYEIIMAEDAMASYFPELHDNSIKVMGTVFCEVKKVNDIYKELTQTN